MPHRSGRAPSPGPTPKDALEHWSAAVCETIPCVGIPPADASLNARAEAPPVFAFRLAADAPKKLQGLKENTARAVSEMMRVRDLQGMLKGSSVKGWRSIW
ncbi:MAG: hypothetical protein EpisKO_25540 [Epibacterium sp.]